MTELIASSITPSLEDRVVTRGMVRKGTGTFKEIELTFLDDTSDYIETDEDIYNSGDDSEGDSNGEDGEDSSGEDSGDDPDYTGRSPGDPVTKTKYLKTLTLPFSKPKKILSHLSI